MVVPFLTPLWPPQSCASGSDFGVMRKQDQAPGPKIASCVKKYPKPTVLQETTITSHHHYWVFLSVEAHSVLRLYIETLENVDKRTTASMLTPVHSFSPPWQQNKTSLAVTARLKGSLWRHEGHTVAKACLLTATSYRLHARSARGGRSDAHLKKTQRQKVWPQHRPDDTVSCSSFPLRYTCFPPLILFLLWQLGSQTLKRRVCCSYS